MASGPPSSTVCAPLRRAPDPVEPPPPVPLRGWTDVRLVRAAPPESAEAWDELFRRHAPSVRASAAAVLGRSSDCEDIVVEVFAALWSRPDRFDPGRGSLAGFLRMRARSAGIDWLRAESRRQVREGNEARGQLRVDPPIETSLLDAEAAGELWLAVAQLPTGQRRAIELAYGRGLSYRAVADQLGIPEGTIKTRIRCGLQHLRLTTDQSVGTIGGVQGA